MIPPGKSEDFCLDPDPTPDPNPPGKPGGGGAAGGAASGDPNELFGAAGYGPEAYIAADTTIPYRINFENLASATAPAQRVDVTDPLSADLDWDTLEFTEVGFGDNVIAVPAGRNYFFATVGMTFNNKFFNVEVELSFDRDTGVVRASFQSVDPGTMLPPDVLTGFLPPEDGTGRGKGYLSFFVKPKAGVATETEIRNVAEIRFDYQQVITTNQVDPEDPSKGTDPAKEALNTIDADAPTVTFDQPPASVNVRPIPLSWGGADVGSGLYAFDVFVSTDGGAQRFWKEKTTATGGTFMGEENHTYTFQVVAYDHTGQKTASAAYAVAVGEVNDPPTDIKLAGTTVAENRPAGTVVGTLSTTDQDAGDTFAYELVAGAVDNASFTLSGGTLKTAAIFNFEAKAGYTVRVKVTDAGGLSKEQLLTVTVTDTAEAPTLDAGPTLMLPAVKINSTRHAGTAVAALLANAADDETPATLSAAVTGFTGAAGTWQHATAATGPWAPVGAATDAMPVYLPRGEFVRFKPGRNVTGYAGLRFRAWDGALASAAAEVAWTPVGVTTKFDARGHLVTKPFKEDKTGPMVVAKTLLGFLPTEFAAKKALSLDVTETTGGGAWQVKIGKLWQAITGRVSPTSLVRFLPAPDWFGDATITYRAEDAATHNFSAEHVTAVATVTPVNDAPTIDISRPRIFTANVAQTVMSLLSYAADVDGTVKGIAITRAAAKAGQWQYRLSAGAGDWVKITGVSAGKALLLGVGAEVRFFADGPVAAALDYKAWDDSTPFKNGDRKPAASTAFSALSETATFSLGNLPPTFKAGAGPAFRGTTKDATVLTVSRLVGRMADGKGFLKGVAVTGLTASAGGSWDYSLDAGKTWQAVGDVSNAKLLLRDRDKLRYTSATAGPATLTFKAWDRTTGAAGDRLADDNDSESIQDLTATLTVT